MLKRNSEVFFSPNSHALPPIFWSGLARKSETDKIGDIEKMSFSSGYPEYITLKSVMPELNFSWAIRETIKVFGLKANWISEKSGVPKQTISAFLNGHQALTTTNLEKILSVFSFEAKQYCFGLLAGQSTRPKLTAIIKAMDSMNPSDRKEAADAMRLIVDKFLPTDRDSENSVKSRENTEELLSVR